MPVPTPELQPGYPFMDAPCPNRSTASQKPRSFRYNVSALPSSASYVVVGAGIHGLSTAYHLAMALSGAARARAAMLS